MFGGVFRMNPECPACGVRFEREPGYFLGAMYLSYGLGVALIAAPAAWLVARKTDPLIIVGATAALLLVLAPFLFRTSRVIWLHFDDHFDPLDGSGTSPVDAE